MSIRDNAREAFDWAIEQTDPYALLTAFDMLEGRVLQRAFVELLASEFTALRPADRRAQMTSSWQLISTAPLDGTLVDLWAVHKDRPAQRVPDCQWNDHYQDWSYRSLTGEADFGVQASGWTPTHWMHRPSLPG